MQPRVAMLWLGLAITSVEAWASQLTVEGGGLHVGTQLGVSELRVGAGGALTGTGTILGQVEIAGTLSPGNPGAEDAHLLTMSGPVAFAAGSVFRCHAATHDSLDRLAVSGAVTGACEVAVDAAVGAVPLGQAIVQAAADSDYAQFVSASADWQLAAGDPGELLLTNLAGDSDGDGMPDWWEDAYLGGRTNGDPEAHSDADPHADLEEYLAGTDPLDADSVFELLSVAAVDSNRYAVAWSSASNRAYDVYRCNDDLVEDAPGIVASNLTSTPPQNVYTDTVDGVALYYRVRISP